MGTTDCRTPDLETSEAANVDADGEAQKADQEAEESFDALEIPQPSFTCVSPCSLLTDNRLFTLGDVRDDAAVPGVTGLRNLGNTCFMNSGLQCLLTNPRLVSFFLEEFDYYSNARHTLTGKFAHLLRKFWSGHFSVLYPSDFKTAVGVDHPQFHDYRQHDCQEFLALLLDSLHEYLNSQSASSCAHVSSACQLSATCCSSLSESSDTNGEELELLSDSYQHIPSSKLTVASPNNCITTPLISGIGDRLLEHSQQSRVRVAITEATPGLEEAVDADLGCQLASLSESTGYLEEESMDVETSSSEESLRRKIPSLDDFCSKDTKTLNTNVLVIDAVETLATDSEKFHKLDNTSEHPASIADIEADSLLDDPMHELLMACDGSKPVKETNLTANCREKFLDEVTGLPYVKQPSMSSVINDCLKPSCSQLLTSRTSLLDDTCKRQNINNTKRIKIDEQAEKNLRMQTKMKVNTEQNCTRAATLVERSGSIDMADDRSLSSPLSAVSISGDPSRPAAVNSSFSNTDRLQARYRHNAQKAWKAYTAKNHSVIVSTFHGQFKSTVICSECHHVSVTFEPFMYLSLPLPHALERQISVIFVPCDNKQPVCYLLTVHCHDSVAKLYSELCQVLGEDESSYDVILAEVFDNHIARILEHKMLIKFVNDAERRIYAFEMLPAPPLETVQYGDCNLETVADNCIANNSASSSSKKKKVPTATLR